MQNQIATEIRNQLGNKALVMLGAYDMLTTPRGLHFKFRGSRKCNTLQIVLRDDDTYTMEFGKYEPLRMTSRGLKGGTFREIDKCDGVYADQLHWVIQCKTGLRLSL